MGLVGNIAEKKRYGVPLFLLRYTIWAIVIYLCATFSKHVGGLSRAVPREALEQTQAHTLTM